MGRFSSEKERVAGRLGENIQGVVTRTDWHVGVGAPRIGIAVPARDCKCIGSRDRSKDFAQHFHCAAQDFAVRHPFATA
jgi:hypothetical protein